MMQSMTGFGNANIETENYSISAEIKTLNGKYFDLKCKLPKSIWKEEIAIRKNLADVIERGNATLYMNIEKIGEKGNYEVSFNKELAKQYYDKITAFGQSLNQDTSSILKEIIRLPEIMSLEEEKEEEGLLDAVTRCYLLAAEKLIEFRTEEGQKISQHFSACVHNIEANLLIVKEQEPIRKSALQERLKSKIEELKKDVDQNRFEQEMIYYLEKIDIAEEIQRLEGHIGYFKQCLIEEPKGKKLGFLSQEMGREINTMGVKANHLPMQKAVVNMKESLEQIKEQVLNVV